MSQPDRLDRIASAVAELVLGTAFAMVYVLQSERRRRRLEAGAGAPAARPPTIFQAP